MEKYAWLVIAAVWILFWRGEMMDRYHEWRWMRTQKKKINEIKNLEDLFKE